MRTVGKPRHGTMLRKPSSSSSAEAADPHPFFFFSSSEVADPLHHNPSRRPPHPSSKLYIPSSTSLTAQCEHGNLSVRNDDTRICVPPTLEFRPNRIAAWECCGRMGNDTTPFHYCRTTERANPQMTGRGRLHKQRHKRSKRNE